MNNKVLELLKLSINEQVDFVMSTNNIYFQFAVAGSCEDYNFFARMPDNIRRDEVHDAIFQMPEDILEVKYNNYFEGIYN